MNKILAATIATLLTTGAFGQALISEPIGQGYSSNPPGYRYADTRTIDKTWTFEIHFRVDSSKLKSNQAYSCGLPVPEGYWLFDRYPSSGSNGSWGVAIGNNQRLCFIDQPRYSWGFDWGRTLEFTGITSDTCHILTAERFSNGNFTVTIDGVSKTNTQGYSDSATYRAGNNGVGVAREINGYSGPQYESFPGEISYVEDDGRVINFSTDGNTTGSAYIGNSVCEGSPPPPPPPPTPTQCSDNIDNDLDGLIDLNDPGCTDVTDDDEYNAPPTACDIDPNSVDCACETNPHPACTVCLAN